MKKTKTFSNKRIILEGSFVTFSKKSYPGRIYGMYEFDHIKNEWFIDKDFCEKWNIKY